MILEGISNLTPTEDRLRNFSRICKLVAISEGVISYEGLIDRIIRHPSIKRGKGGREGRYTKTIERHIKIMKYIEILEKSNDDIFLPSLGKALYELVKNKDNFEENLEDPEKIFYFVALFSKPVAIQLSLLLKSIGKRENRSKNDIIKDYIQSVLALPPNMRIFDREYLKKCVQAFNKYEMFPIAMTNKINCMNGWLKNLELIAKGPRLTPAGEKVLWGIRPSSQRVESWYPKIGENVSRLSHYILNSTEFPAFDENNIEHDKAVINLFKNAYSKFYRSSIKMSDVLAIRMWLSISLLISENLIIEKRDFDTFLKNQVTKGNFKSIAQNDKGRLAYVEI